MGLFGEKSEKPDAGVLLAEKGYLLREIEMLREQLAEKRSDILSLREQLRWTQLALVAKEAPEAYRDRQDAEAAAAQRPASPEELEAQQMQADRRDITARYLQELEGPLFKDGDDMIAQLTRVTGVPIGESHSIHGNEES
jgi:hypothetical protein